MSHEVETMAYAHAVPWHGLGVNIDANAPVADWVHAAGIDWEVELRPLMAACNKDEDAIYDIPVDDHFALVRKTDNRVMTITGDRWTPVQNRQVVEFFEHFLSAGGATMETLGALRGGRVVWGLASLNEKFVVNGKEDIVKGYLLLASHHILGRATIAKVTPVRVVCANTLAMATNTTGAIERRFSHTKSFEARVAAEAIGLVREEFQKFGKLANQLARLNLTDSDVLNILRPVMDAANSDEPLTGYEPNRQIAKTLEAYTSAPGATPGTGWGLLNAVTYYADHQAKAQSPDHRLASSWFGTYANIKQKVLDRLVEMAD